MMQDRVNEILEATRVLMRKRQQQEACRLLSQERDRAVLEGLPEEAALYSSVRGSYLVAMGRDEEAYEAYRDAEKLSNGDVHDKLLTARHLVFGLGRPEEGFKKAEEVITSETESVIVQHQAHSIQGLARLAMNQPEEAANSLRRLIYAIQSNPAQTSSLDLSLVEELAKDRTATDLCRTYLDLVESRTANSQNSELLSRILSIKGSLG